MTTDRWMQDGVRATSGLGAVGAATLGAFLVCASPAIAQFSGRASLANLSSAGAQGDAASSSVALSADGKLVAFASEGENLVPLDTNGDTDVFLHDTVTRITKRVSVNWQGKEAQGDSACPSLSADGRYVAFSTRAWNMWQGGENVGTPRWEVYLHDRQGPDTIRVSVPLDGGHATADSGCPVISADGSRVAFASDATDLVPGDTNGFSDVFVYEVAGAALTRVSVSDGGLQALDGPSDAPAISADGTVVAFTSAGTNLTAESPLLWSGRQQVYVRDLVEGTTEMVSRAFAAPAAVPEGESCCPRISDDGRVVLFHSIARNLVSAASGQGRQRLFVRDRTSGATEAVESLSLDPGLCGFLSDPLFCYDSATKAAALSADGRFVAFLSASFQLLPENLPFRYDQIYLQDRQTRRLRRVSVDPTGYPTLAYPCGGSSGTLALSADGRVLAFAGEDTAALGLVDANGGEMPDVVRLEWTCGAAGTCRALSACPGTPVDTCEPATRSHLRLRRNPPLAPRRERFHWRWVGAGAGGSPPFVDPAEADYHLCVYGGETMSVQLDAGIPADDERESIENGWQRTDRGGAVERVTLRSSPKRAMATVASSSPALDLPYLPLDAPHGVRVQLHETTTDRCWEAAFPAEALRINTRGAVTSKGATPGIVRATLY